MLYGLYARGDYNKSSDITILADLSDKEISEYCMKIWEKSDIEIDQGIVISPLVRNVDNRVRILQIHDALAVRPRKFRRIFLRNVFYLIFPIQEIEIKY